MLQTKSLQMKIVREVDPITDTFKCDEFWLHSCSKTSLKKIDQLKKARREEQTWEVLFSSTKINVRKKTANDSRLARPWENHIKTSLSRFACRRVGIRYHHIRGRRGLLPKKNSRWHLFSSWEMVVILRFPNYKQLLRP